MKPDLFQAPDYYLLDDLLTDEHKLVRDSARAWVKREVSPIIEDYAQRAEFPKQIIKGLGEIGGFGPYIPEEYGGAGLDQISYGLIMQEIERGDSGVRSTSSVQSSLVMYPIWKFGTEEQRVKYLPKLATGEFMGCFGLTEPDHGSNPSGFIGDEIPLLSRILHFADRIDVLIDLNKNIKADFDKDLQPKEIMGLFVNSVGNEKAVKHFNFLKIDFFKLNK